MSRIATAVLGIIALGGAFVKPALAQKGTELTVGVMAGVNYGKASQDPTSPDFTFEYKTGWLAGAFLGIQVNDVFSLEPQALYSSKGTKLKGTGSNSGIEATIKINYLEVPVLAKFWIPSSGSQVRPFVFVGPEGEFKVSCTVEGAAFGFASATDCDKAPEIKLKSTSFGVTAGGGFEVRGAKQVVRFDARYTHGLTNINNSTDKTTVKLRTFAVTAGVGVPLPR